MSALDGQVVLVTGGARGIGAAIVATALAQGALVSFCDLDGAAVDAAVERLGDGRRDAIHATVADVTSEQDVERWVDAATAALGRPTGLVNNAGRNSNLDAARMTVAEWDDFMALDLRAAWLCARALLPGMRDAGHGSIVSIASVHAHATVRGYFPYAAAKAGLLGFTRSLALDEARRGIRVNSVSPGMVWTEAAARHFDGRGAELDRVLEQLPMGRAIRPAEVAQVVCFLLSEAASGVTGTDVKVDGGHAALIV